MMLVQHDQHFVALLLEIRGDHVDLLVVKRASLEVLLVVRDVRSVDEDVERSVRLQKCFEAPEVLHPLSVSLFRAYVSFDQNPNAAESPARSR